MLNFNYSPTEEILRSNTSERLLSFKSIIDDPKYGFFKVVERQDLIESSKNLFQKFQNKKSFVHVGVGGSALGTETLINALQKNNFHFEFINNIDPDMIFDQLNRIEIKETLFYFCSKSGGTAETMAALAIVSSKLKEAGISEDQFKDYMVFATDPVKSDLLNLGKEFGISCLEVPSNVGGRFSALTPIGFFPCLFAGIDIEKLCSGAVKLQSELLKKENNQLIEMCDFLFSHMKKNYSQTVFMPYSSKLKDLSFWFTQLWAESLGKKTDKDGQTVHTGLTPIPAYGATDQHSQVQLFMEGPFDKCLILLEIKNFNNDFSLDSNFNTSAFNKLQGKTLANLMSAEFHGTLRALKEAGRPFVHISLDQRNEETLGALMLLFESLTALMGAYLNIDPFDQPGVEAGKLFAYEFLEKQR